MSTMQIRAIPEDGAVRLVVQGELDLVGASDLMEAMEAIECPAAVVLDLRAVTFLDSAGLRAILAARSDPAGRQRRVTVVQGPRQVEQVLELAGVNQIVDV